MTNHYPEELLKDYSILLQYFPSHTLCRPYIVEAIELWKNTYAKEGAVKVLEIGPGFGETTEMILEKIAVHMTLVEVDVSTIGFLSQQLEKYKNQINIVQADVTSWIKNQPSQSYDVFTASWVIHNFPKDQREEFLVEIRRVLRPGGLFIIFDKILSENSSEMKKVWEEHMKRLQGLDTIGKSEAKDNMILHEIRDAQEPFVWYEHDLFLSMDHLGFSKNKVIMRNERDVVFSAQVETTNM